MEVLSLQKKQHDRQHLALQEVPWNEQSKMIGKKLCLIRAVLQEFPFNPDCNTWIDRELTRRVTLFVGNFDGSLDHYRYVPVPPCEIVT